MTLDKYKDCSFGFKPLSEWVDTYMALSFNNDRKYYKNMLIVAEQVWKELYWNVIPSLKHKRVAVDKRTMTAMVPPDSMLLRKVSIIDECSNIAEMTTNPYKWIEPYEAKGCGCKECNCNNQTCGYLQSGIQHISEDVYLDDVKYQRVIKTKTCANGDLLHEITEPYAVKLEDGIEVQFRTYSEVKATLDVKPCGCLKDSDQNTLKVYSTCGCPVRCCDPTDRVVRANTAGHYKVEGDTIYLFDSDAKYVVCSYITNGDECSTEIMIPEYCNNAMNDGMFYYSVRWRRDGGSGERERAERKFEKTKLDLYMFLAPFSDKEFSNLANKPHVWGT